MAAAVATRREVGADNRRRVEMGQSPLRPLWPPARLAWVLAAVAFAGLVLVLFVTGPALEAGGLDYVSADGARLSSMGEWVFNSIAVGYALLAAVAVWFRYHRQRRRIVAQELRRRNEDRALLLGSDSNPLVLVARPAGPDELWPAARLLASTRQRDVRRRLGTANGSARRTYLRALAAVYAIPGCGPVAALTRLVVIRSLLEARIWVPGDAPTAVVTTRPDHLGDVLAGNVAAHHPGYTAARPVLEALTRQADELGITLHARPGDPALASLYHELGFHSAGTRPRLRRDPHLPATTNGGT